MSRLLTRREARIAKWTIVGFSVGVGFTLGLAVIGMLLSPLEEYPQQLIGAGDPDGALFGWV